VRLGCFNAFRGEVLNCKPAALFGSITLRIDYRLMPRAQDAITHRFDVVELSLDTKPLVIFRSSFVQRGRGIIPCLSIQYKLTLVPLV